MQDIKKMRVLGRNLPGGICEDGAVRLFWAGDALELCVKATEVWAHISCNYDYHEIWLAVEVNGYQTARFVAPKKPTLICIARNLNPEKQNLISIIKDTQPMPGDNKHELKIDSVSLNEDGSFCDLKPRRFKIEFIGDSITSGEGLAGNPDEMDWITQWFCGSKTYAVQTAKLLNADWSCMSQCGWGISWGWDGDVTSSIPFYYDQICGLLRGSNQTDSGTCNEFKFGSGSKYVVINLGTNDNTGFKCYDDGKGANGKAGITIISDVKRFLKEIRRFNPDAKIIWTYGMIPIDIVPSLIKQGIDEYKKQNNDINVYMIELEGMDVLEKKEEDKGSRGHPGPLTHKRAALRLAEFIKKLEG